MATVKDLFNAVFNSFYKESLAGPDQELLGALLDGYSKAVADAYRLLYQRDQAKSIDRVKPTVERDFWHLDLGFQASTETPFVYQIEREIVSIPKLQQGLSQSHEGVILTDTTDYVVNSRAHTIEFVSVAGKAAVTRTIILTDNFGRRTPAGLFVDGGGAAGLTVGVDYDIVDAATWKLYSRAAFDLFATSGDTAAVASLEQLRLWAPLIHVDDGLVYQNFGFLLGISPDDIPVDIALYTRIVGGLWYIAWNGPTPFNLVTGVSVLFGYPVAPEAGLIQAIQPSGPDVVVTVATPAGELVEALVPANFTVTVSVGQAVLKNQALSDAVTILDEQTSPGWWSRLSLARYADKGLVPGGLTAEQELELKSMLKNSVFGIKLKDSHDQPEIVLRSQVLTVASRFLERLKPYYTQFAFVDDIVFVETVDEATAQDVELRFKVKRKMQQTIPGNPVNELYNTPNDDTYFLNYDAYEAASPTPTDSNRAYYLGADAGLTGDSLSFQVKYPGSGGLFVPVSDLDYQAYNSAALADLTPPDLFLSPDPGDYFSEISVRVRPDEPCEMLYTLDGRTPEFGDIPVGSPVRGRIPLPEGDWPLKVIAKDLSGNISPILSVQYRIRLGMPPVRLSPPPEIPAREPVQVLLRSDVPDLDVFYTTDGSAPTDFVFQDVLRLGGHRIVYDSPTSIRLEDPKRPVFFTRGTATLNVDGARNYEIAPRRNARYFVYLVRLGDNRFRLHFSLDNIRFEPNTPTRLLLGFVCSNASGIFTPSSIVNALDAGDSIRLEKDLTITDGILNTENPIPLLNDQSQRIVRFFAKTPGGLFDPPQTHVYDFDTVAPVTVLTSSFSNKPFTKTLQLDFETEPGATVYWSETTKSPQKIIFGLADRLVDGVNLLELVYAGTPNRLVPNFTTFTLKFKKRAPTGELVELTTTADVRAGGVVRILGTDGNPAAANSFYDIIVVPDFDNPGKWRLDVGPPNVSVREAIDIYKVARIFTDNDGVLNPTAGKGSIINATTQAGLSNLARKTKKYVGEPLTFNVTSAPYKIELAYFAEDAAGNVEETRVQTFQG